MRALLSRAPGGPETLEQGGEAIAHMAARKAVGKVVVTMG